MFNEMVKKAKLGDEQALGEILERLQPLLISSIRRYYNKPKEYEDLMQDGNLKIIESIFDYDETKGVNFLGYIKMNIKFLYLDKHKERLHESLNEMMPDGQRERIDILIGPQVDFLENIIILEDRQLLQESLDTLTEKQRQIIELFYIKNMAIGQIASKLGLSYRTVVNTKTRALDKMRNL